MINEEVVNWTVSNLFLVPLLNIGRSKLNKLGFVNSYLYNGEEDVLYEDAIHLLFKPDDLNHINQFILVENRRHYLIIDEHDYPGGLVLLTYKLPERYREDYKKIWEGKYSEVSSDFKNSIPSMVKYINSKGVSVTNMTVQHMIIERYQPLKKYWEDKFSVVMDDDQELWTKPTLESETFKLKNHEPITIDA